MVVEEAPDARPVVPSRRPRGKHRASSPRRRSSTVLMVLAALAFFFGPARPMRPAPRASEIENRRLTAFPDFIETGWGGLKSLGPWATDHLPGRTVAVDTNNWFTTKVFREQPNYGRTTGGAGGPGEPGGLATGDGVGTGSGGVGAGTGGGSTGTGGGSTGSGTVAYPEVVQGKDGWLYYGADMANRCNATRTVDSNIDGLRQLTKIVTSSGRKLVIIVAPDKTTIYPGHLPDRYAGQKCVEQVTPRFWSALRAAKDLPSVDLRAALENSQPADQLTYRPHDTHFSGLGQTVFARQMAAALDPSLAVGTTVPIDGYIDSPGDLALFTGERITDRLPNYIISRAGVTQSPDSNVTLGFHVTDVRNTSTSAPLYQTPTLLLGDSFTDVSRQRLVPYFADLHMLHCETGALDPQRMADAFIDRGTVVYEIVERSISTGAASLVSPKVLAVLQTTLTAHPYSG